MSQLTFPILSSLLILCLLASLTISILPSKGKTIEQISALCFKTSLLFSALILGITGYLFYVGFSAESTGLQFVESYRWLGNISSFKLGVDGLSLSMVLLLGILLPFVIMASEPIARSNKPKLYYSLLFLLCCSVFGVFVAQDLLFFFVFWELELLPMYLLISIWGGENRLKAANKFILYTFFGGAFILLGILLLFWLSGGKTFSIIELGNEFRRLQTSGALAQNMGIVHLVFALFAIGFCVKLPSIPFHTWLPEAHVEAPTPISMLLAGILLKMGAYGLIRFGTEFFPDSVIAFAPYLAALGALNIIGGAIFALVQDDMKRVIAYSSISHMGFILLGLATVNTIGINGAIFQMFSHGLISAGLFMIIGSIYERAHTRKISEFSGLAKNMKLLFYLFIGLAMANLGLPALSGFVGESLVFYGAFSSESLPFATQIQGWTIVSTFGVIITAGYMLWLGKRLFYGEIAPKWSNISDLRPIETTILGSLLGLSLLFGIYPRLISDKVEPTANKLAANFKWPSAEVSQPMMQNSSLK